MNLDDDILQDFLVEAGEILEQLNEQLVDLEQHPDDLDLLNSVFRGFHTVKGGAGFLGLADLVDICHQAEDVFNALRQGELRIDAGLMDAVLRAFDVINGMFAQIAGGEEPLGADPELLAELARYVDSREAGAAERELEDPPADGGGPAGTVAGGDDITEDEFDALLDILHGAGNPPRDSVAAGPVDDISEDEFDALLDQLHGAGRAPAGLPPAQPDAVSEAEPGNAGDAAGARPPPVAAPTRAPEPGRRGAAAARPESSVRVDTRRLDDIMNLVGELVLARNRLTSLRSSFENEKVAQAVAALDLVTADLQGAVMKTRMQPIKKVFGRFPRVVRDLARALDKEVALTLTGEDTDLDKNLVDALADPLVHLVRNAIDHGIEPPEVREAAGKPRTGSVVLSAEQAGDNILLTIRDDGAGIDPERLRAMAIANGMLDKQAAERLSTKECYDLIFLPGASTKAEITDVSGRGVGMDVVKTRITQLNGTVDIDSDIGCGTTLSIKVPLTLAILPTLMVVLGRRKFALPLSVVNEIFELSQSRTHIVDGQTVVQVRGSAPPLFFLREWLLQPDERDAPVEHAQVIMVQIGNRAFGLVVDQVVGQEEVVIKPLGALLQGLPGLSGATITGDGNIALILDVAGLMRAYATGRS